MSDSLRPHESQHARPPCPSSTPGVHSDSCPLSQWCHPAISTSVVPFSSCPLIPLSIRVFSNESPVLEACSHSCPLSQWCHPTISFSVVPFYSCFQSFPASESFPMSRLSTCKRCKNYHKTRFKKEKKGFWIVFFPPFYLVVFGWVLFCLFLSQS